MESGFNKGAFATRPDFRGAFNTTVSIPRAPTLAPVLSVDAELSSTIAELTWTPSNRVLSPGFRYELYGKLDAGAYALLHSAITDTFINWDVGLDHGTWTFKIRPINDVGGGPFSNEVAIALPGESESQFRLLEDGTGELIEDATERLLEAA